jgi:carboxypeptidase family protein/TonB-dependent receptor-like protein
MKHIVKAFTLFLVLAAIPAAAQTLVGSVTGVVKDEQGGALPGVVVSLAGKTGTKTTTTGTDGSYRFAAVDPGTYSVQANVNGFSTQKQDGIAVSVGKQVAADFSMKVGGRTDEITVTAEAPVVDTQSSSTQNQLSQDLLFNMPIRQGNTATNLLNFAPGINNGSAYGGDADSANGLLIDGVDTRDPSGGTAWTFYNFNIVDEVQIQGVGAPAEYGAFSGAIVNTVTKSGGNRFAGLFDAIWTKASLGSNNLTNAITTANPALADPAKTKTLTDITTQLSGPIVKDKLFFFLSAQRYHKRDDPSGPSTIRDEISPRVNGKLTWQPSANDTIMGHLQYDSYSIIGRAGVPVLQATDALTNREDAPEWVWITNWRHLFGSKTFVEMKYTGWWGFYDLNPEVNRPARLDENGGYNSVVGGQGWFYYGDRGRHQLNASLSHFADKWGKHNLKFGVEIERSKTRDRYGLVPNGLYYYDYGGAPYYAYSYGYDIQGRNKRNSLYAQDSWEIGSRLTINPGVRVDFLNGKHPDGDTVYDTTSVAPRFGFAFDLTGDHRTVLKGSYSQYYENIFNDIYKAATPGIQDFVSYNATACPSIATPCPRNLLEEVDRTVTPIATVDPNIKHPRVDEFSLGFERALGKDIRVSITGMRRENKNLIGTLYPDARWEPRTLTSTAAEGLPAQPVLVYRWMNSASSENNLLITNPDGFVFRDVNGNPLGTVDAFRRYKALMTVISKRFSNRWVAQLSYVLQKAEGSRDNTSEGTYLSTSAFFKTPTLALTNTNGESTNSRRHELKVMFGVQVPVVEIGINAYWRSLSGRPYTPEQRFASSTFGGGSFVPFSSWRTPIVVERGSHRRQNENILDVRLEKIFNIGSSRKNRLALYADITNAFNKTVVTTLQVRTPSLAISGLDEPVAFGAPAAVIAPRQATLGARWSF